MLVVDPKNQNALSLKPSLSNGKMKSATSRGTEEDIYVPQCERHKQTLGDPQEKNIVVVNRIVLYP